MHFDSNLRVFKHCKCSASGQSSSSSRRQLLYKAMFYHRVMHSQSFLPRGAGFALQSSVICLCGSNTSSLLSYYKLFPLSKSLSSSVIPAPELNFPAWVGYVAALMGPFVLSCLFYNLTSKKKKKSQYTANINTNE